MTAWLLKTEPGAYSYEDLERDGTTHWDGVTNATAQLNLRAMQVDDPVVIYHSQTDKAAIGLGRVVRAPTRTRPTSGGSGCGSTSGPSVGSPDRSR